MGVNELLGKRMVWAEGIFLSQQHFQLWDALLRQQQYSYVEAVQTFNWGVLDLKWNLDNLGNGTLVLQSCCCIFQNGLLVRVTDYDSPLEIKLSPKEAVQNIYLAMPNNEYVNDIAGYKNRVNDSGFQTYFVDQTDSYDPSREQEVMLATPNLSLVSAEDEPAGCHAIKVAKLHRLQDRRFEVDDAFIPSALHVKTSRVAMNLLRSIIEDMEANLRVLEAHSKEIRHSAIDLRHGELTYFLLTMVVHHFLPELQHIYQQGVQHPEALYRVLIKYLGQLCVFSQVHKNIEFPRYDHNDLSSCLVPLRDYARALLKDAIPAKMAGVDLAYQGNNLYRVVSISSDTLRDNNFYLAVFMESETTAWIDEFSKHIKLGAPCQLDTIIASALPGVRLAHVQRTPMKLPIKGGYEYFRIEKQGSFWREVLDARSLSLFVSDQFREAKLEMVAIQE